METLHISLQSEILGSLWGMPISNTLTLSILAAILIIGGGLFVVRNLKTVPGKVQNALEVTIKGMLDFMTETLGGERERAKEFFPIVAAFFFFILFNNLIGLVPGIEAVKFVVDGEKLKFFRPANSDLNTTLALALVSVGAAQVYGIKKLGVGTYLGKFFPFRHGPIHVFVGLLELMGEFAKVMSFSFRLFGNIFAGKVLLAVTMALVPFIAPIPFLALEIFIGFIQAFIFAMLTLVFLKIATEHAEH